MNTTTALLRERVNLTAVLAEFCGIIFFVTTIGLTVHSNQPAGIKSACVALILAIQITAMGSVSGGHFNPAVSFSIYISANNKLTGFNLVAYVCMQSLGSLCGALLSWGLTRETFVCTPGDAARFGDIFIAEVFFTTILCFTVLCVALDNAGGPSAGLFIGLVVFCAGVSIGDISGGCINPAVAFGGYITNALAQQGFDVMLFLLYLLVPFLGSCLAAIIFFYTRPNKYRGIKYETSKYRYVPPWKIDGDIFRPPCPSPSPKSPRGSGSRSPRTKSPRGSGSRSPRTKSPRGSGSRSPRGSASSNQEGA